MVDVATLQIKVDTKDLARGEASLEALQREGVRAEKVVDQLGNTAQRTGTRVRSVGGSAGAAGRQFQNAAFQVGDFAVQMASGQRASVALAQQLPQLLGGFGLLGAALGAVVAIGGALVPVLFDMTKGIDDLDDALERVKDTAEDLRAPLKILELSAVDLGNKFGEAAENIRTAALFQAQISIEQASRALRDQVDIVENLADAYRKARAQGPGFVADIEKLAQDFEISASAAEDLFKAFVQFDRAGTLDEQQIALQRIVDFMQANNVEASKLPPELQDALDIMIELGRETAVTEEWMRRAAAAAAEMTVPGMGDLLELQAAFENGTLLPEVAGGSGSGGGRVRGGGADTFAKRLETLQNSLRTEREVVDAWYQESQDILANRRAMEILGEQDHREALLRVEEEYQAKLRDIRLSEQDRTLGYTASFFGAMAQATAAGGDKMAKAAAVFGAIEATVNAYRAAAQALADPSVPFWGKAAAYTSVLATGLQAVSAIKGAGSGGGGAVAPTAVAAPPPNTSPRVAITLQGETFSAKQVRDLINAINQEVEAGAIVRLA